MAQETLKITITADNKEAVNNINQTVAATQQMAQSFSQVPTATNQANQALINSGRVLQDLNYGFIGVANNLNPLLESFQRLEQRAKETGSSLSKEIGAALMGPAGIGVALSAVTFLVLKYGDTLSNFISQTIKGKDALTEQNTALNSAKEGFINAYTEVQQLKSAFESFHNGAISRQEVLSKYNSLLGDTYGKTKDINEAERIFVQNSENYIKAAVLRAAALIEIKKAAEAAANAEELKRAPKEQFTPLFQAGGQYAGATTTKGLTAIQEANKKEAISAATIVKDFHQSVANSLNALADEFTKTGTKTKEFYTGSTTDVKGWSEEMKNRFKEIESIVREYNALPHPKHQEMQIERESLVNKQAESVLKKKATTEGDNWAQQQMYDITKAQNAEQEKFNNNINLTKDIVGNLAPAFESVFSAMVMGEDVGKALEASFKQIVVQLISMVTQALLFKAILTALNIGTGGFGEAAASAVGFGGGFGGFLGEFLLRGSDLVLATQRANTNLSYRR